MIPRTCLLCNNDLCIKCDSEDGWTRAYCPYCKKFSDNYFPDLTAFELIYLDTVMQDCFIKLDNLDMRIIYKPSFGQPRIIVSEIIPKEFNTYNYRKVLTLNRTFPYQHNLDYLTRKLKLILTFS